MVDKEKTIRDIISDFENRKLSGEIAIEKIKALTGNTIDISYLAEYWASESLDDFVKKLVIESISDWNNITDDKAIELINEILANVSDDSIIDRNSDALEKRYGKPTGMVWTKIFSENIADPHRILAELKRETRFFL